MTVSILSKTMSDDSALAVASAHLLVHIDEWSMGKNYSLYSRLHSDSAGIVFW